MNCEDEPPIVHRTSFVLVLLQRIIQCLLACIVQYFQQQMHYSPYAKRKQGPEISPLQSTKRKPFLKENFLANPERLIQQLQIQELEQKVDIIMLHNQKLMAENSDLRKALYQNAQTNNIHFAQENFIISKLKMQLDGKQAEIEAAQRQCIVTRQTLTEEIEKLTLFVQNLKTENEELSQENQQANKLSKTFNKRLEQQVHRALTEVRSKHQEQIKNLQQRCNVEKKRVNESRLESMVRLEEVHESEKKQLERGIKDDYERRVEKLEGQIIERCRQERQKAEEYIEKITENLKVEPNVENDVLKREIQVLKKSLQSRKSILLEFTKSEGPSDQDDHRWFEELIKTRQQHKKTIHHFMRESELLKLKTAQQHEIDVNQVAKSYSTQLQVLNIRIEQLERINADLRARYEEEIRMKLNMKQNFEIKLSQLKNLIKKLKIDLDKASDDYRLSIEGIKESQMALSSHLIIDVQNKKIKENFFQQQLKKLRTHLEKQDDERNLIEKQCQEKVKYFGQKLKDAQARLMERQKDFEEKERDIEKHLRSKQDQAKQFVQREKTAIKALIQAKERQVQKMRDQMLALRSDNQATKVELSEKYKDIQDLRQQIESSKAHIEALKLEIDMRGFDERNDEAKKRESWKSHYDRRIKELEQDKQHLKQEISLQNERISQVLSKYKDLEQSLEKTVSGLKKRTDLERRIVQIGMDGNLVKNLAELFDS